MEQFLMDTNCVSHYLSGLIPSKGMQFMDSVIDAGPRISIITQIELLCWNTPEKDKIVAVSDFISDSIIYEVTQDIVAHCVALRKGRKIKTPDAIIAATALAQHFTLITRNEKDFNNIPKLKIINPGKL